MAGLPDENPFGKRRVWGEVHESLAPQALSSVRRNKFPQRHFWEQAGNLEVMQQILGEFYSASDKSDFLVKPQHNNKTRLMVTCVVCGNKDLTSYEHFIGHYEGRKHKEEVALRHQDIRDDYFPEGSLEYKLVESEKPVIGLSMVYKSCYRGREIFCCQLCDVRHKDQEMMEHLLGKDHAREYIRVKFHKSLRGHELQEEIKKIFEREGGVNYRLPIFD